MSQTQTGIDALVNVLIPKIIDRIKILEEQVATHEVALNKMFVELTQCTVPHVIESTKDNKRTRAKKAAKLTAEEVITQAAEAATQDPTTAAVDVPTSTSAAGAAVENVVAVVQEQPAAAPSVSAPSTPVSAPGPAVIAGVPITGDFIQYIAYIMGQGEQYHNVAVIAQVLQCSPDAVQYVFSLSHDQQLETYKNFPPSSNPPAQA